MSSEVKRYEAVHLRYDDNNIRYGEGCEVEVVLESDYAALEAENARLLYQRDTAYKEYDRTKSALMQITARYFAGSIQVAADQQMMDEYLSEGIRQLQEERDAARAQLAAIQGGMGEVVGFDRNAAYVACPESGCDWGSFYVGWKAAAAQHQRITAAMVAEVERLCGEVKTLTHETELGLNAYCQVQAERDALRAELETLRKDASADMEKKYL